MGKLPAFIIGLIGGALGSTGGAIGIVGLMGMLGGPMFFMEFILQYGGLLPVIYIIIELILMICVATCSILAFFLLQEVRMKLKWYVGLILLSLAAVSLIFTVFAASSTYAFIWALVGITSGASVNLGLPVLFIITIIWIAASVLSIVSGILFLLAKAESF